MKDHHIGTLAKTSQDILGIQGKKLLETMSSEFLNSRSWSKAILYHKEIVSWDTRRLTFKLNHDSQTLGLPVGQHILMKLDSGTGDPIIRPYTPISEPDERGTMTLLVKIYFPTANSRGGKMGIALEKLSLGSAVEFKGPIGKFEYQGKGQVLVRGIRRRVQSLRMVCGGSGIAPIFQILRAVGRDLNDPTPCVVLDSNRQEEDILCRSELDKLVEKRHDRFKVLHTLTQPPASWTGQRGRISQPMLKEYCAVPGGGGGESSMVLICGPRPFEAFVHGVLLEQGWQESDLVFF